MPAAYRLPTAKRRQRWRKILHRWTSLHRTLRRQWMKDSFFVIEKIWIRRAGKWDNIVTKRVKRRCWKVKLSVLCHPVSVPQWGETVEQLSSHSLEQRNSKTDSSRNTITRQRVKSIAVVVGSFYLYFKIRIRNVDHQLSIIACQYHWISRNASFMFGLYLY